ncbi:NDP-hexose 2,3-dehydratase [Clostridiaceae bacterium JG1575]|nr:NDP-hexose 2,3-dehydratase [Clostridiaceae bacterium JG1575]
MNSSRKWDLMASWQDRVGRGAPTAEILQWIHDLNEETHVKIQRESLNECRGWSLDEETGVLRNDGGTFFQVAGLEAYLGDCLVDQPILLQDEIGFLGILCRFFGGVLHFLMQAKIEPGNINKIQLSPTLQATKSNFTQKHGGAQPKYLSFFRDARKHEILYDQIQSEQAARFLGKRNRNMVVLTKQEVPLYANWRWMTLGQIHELLTYDNIVNMDTRTVLSGLPFGFGPSDEGGFLEGDPLFQSMKGDGRNKRNEAFHCLNNQKMFAPARRRLVPLQQLNQWVIEPERIYNPKGAPFEVCFFEIEIEGREVRHWHQPLFAAKGRACFILVCARLEGRFVFLVHLSQEAGTFDSVEWGPTAQWEAGEVPIATALTAHLQELMADEKTHLACRVLSEEGGRFYHEENLNYILEGDYDVLQSFVGGDASYLWLDYHTLLRLMEANNVLNIQLRNLLALLDFTK